MHEWTCSLPPDKYKVCLTDTYLNVSAKILTNVPALLIWSHKNPSPFTFLLKLVY